MLVEQSHEVPDLQLCAEVGGPLRNVPYKPVLLRLDRGKSLLCHVVRYLARCPVGLTVASDMPAMVLADPNSMTTRT